jgi:hypothetical protein
MTTLTKIGILARTSAGHPRRKNTHIKWQWNIVTQLHFVFSSLRNMRNSIDISTVYERSIYMYFLYCNEVYTCISFTVQHVSVRWPTFAQHSCMYAQMYIQIFHCGGVRAGRIVYSRLHVAYSFCPDIYTTMRSARGPMWVTHSVSYRSLFTGRMSGLCQSTELGDRVKTPRNLGTRWILRCSCRWVMCLDLTVDSFETAAEWCV